jgi:hypothetical protein
MLRTHSLPALLFAAASVTGLVAQESANPRFNDPPPPPAGEAAPANEATAPNAPAIPATLTVPAGSFVSIRVNQWLSSDRNQPGDTFYATLAQPLIVNGVVVARRGSTVMGRVSDAQKAGRVQGLSKLGLQLTNLSLVDGQQVSVQSQVIDRNGHDSVGNDAVAIGATTGIGAAIGASAAGGSGAAIGAGAGAIASTLGVLLTRGRPTEIYPETMLTFRLDSPVAISTAQAPAAFRYADQQDYAPSEPRLAQQRPPRPSAVYGAPYPYPYPYPYYGRPYYGPGLSVYIGPGYYGHYRGYRRW